MNHSKNRIILSYLIIFCLILIQFTPLAAIFQAEEVEESYQLYPHLLITEISPDSVGPDLYEFFEVYNNTNEPITLNNYAFHYVYTDGSATDKIFPIPENTIIGPQQTLVFWSNTQDKAPAEFNDFFGTSLPEEQIISYKDQFPGFSNTGNRGITIKNRAEANDYLGKLSSR